MKSLLYRASILATALALSACGGGGGGGGGGSTPPPAGNVTVNGRITFDRVPFSATPGNGLDYTQTFESPARRVVVEAIRSNGALIASTATDDDGNYSVQVPAGIDMRIRAKAQSVVTSTAAAPVSWSVSIRNNTSGNALYVLDSVVFNSGSTAQARDLRAASGWGNVSYTSTRAAAPFAVLDTMYSAIRFVVEQGGYTGAFPSLDVFWSTRNSSSVDFAPAAGRIQTTGYYTFQDGVGNGIYVLGDADLGAASDTDEFDQHVIAHEFFHYMEDRLARSDSLGGDHSRSDRLDLRVAFSEGFADAFGAMVVDDPVYRDSYGTRQGLDVPSDLEANTVPVRGWYNEASMASIAWDLFDTAADGVDTGSVGFSPMFDVYRNELRTGVPLSSIFAFAAALKQRAGVDDALVNALVGGQDIVAGTINPYATTETNNGGLPDALPVYEQLTLNGPTVEVCGTRDAGVYNKLGNRRHLRFNVPGTRQIQILVTAYDGASPPDARIPDPDLYIWKAGFFDYSECAGPDPGAGCTLPQNSERYTGTLPAGDYVLEVFEYSHVNPDPSADRRGRTCMLVSITG
ncbi:MAG: hypothetical protein MUO39_12245 [Steroidobacteraceae bacterium]|nr:hypothetical protein [Steroidobacteraceae bacterium]